MHHKEGTQSSFRRQYSQAEVIERLLDKHVALWIENGYCHPCKPTPEHPRQVWNSPLLGVPTLYDKNRRVIEIRPCMNLQGVNLNLIDEEVFPMTTIREMLTAVSGAN